MVLGRGLLAALAALALTVAVVRNAVVEDLAPLRPDAAAAVWSTHPAVELSAALAAIGGAARAGHAIDPRIFSLVQDAAAKSPLSPEPFVIRGVQAQTSGEPVLAERAFRAAQWRDPRSLSAAYFLAEHYFRRNHPLEGLEQTALLARLAPNGTAAVAPFIASYAEDPRHAVEIRRVFADHEALAESVFSVLAQDGRNAGTILALTSRWQRRPNSPWLPILLNSLIMRREYSTAKAIWSRIGSPNPTAAGLIYDPRFAEPVAPPPFNWALSTSAVGIADRDRGGHLHVLFYGNEDGVLATELLLLPTGRYTLTTKLVGSSVHPETLFWQVRCDRSAQPFASASLPDVAKAGLRFTVSPDCPAQWLELSTRSADVAQQAEVSIAPLALTSAGGDA